jgi:hypothetical protein
MNSEARICAFVAADICPIVPADAFTQMSGERKFGSSPLGARQNQTAIILEIIPLRIFSKP